MRDSLTMASLNHTITGWILVLLIFYKLISAVLIVTLTAMTIGLLLHNVIDWLMQKYQYKLYNTEEYFDNYLSIEHKRIKKK